MAEEKGEVDSNCIEEGEIEELHISIKRILVHNFEQWRE